MIEFITNTIEFITNNIDMIVSWGGALTSSIFAYQTQKKDKKMQVELAKYEVLNEQLTYIRNSYFDYEFDIYKELSKKTCLLTSALNTYFFQGFRQIHESDLKQKENAEELLKKVIESYYEYRDVLFMSGPFIPEDEFNEFEKFMNLCFLQYQIYPLTGQEVLFYLQAVHTLLRQDFHCLSHFSNTAWHSLFPHF